MLEICVFFHQMFLFVYEFNFILIKKKKKETKISSD